MSHLSLEELELIDEPKYRNYISSVDKALKNFEYTSEWADLISALGKLNKVLHSHSKFNVIPRRVVIAKRLAQCLHPALPSGVHLKALETYDLVFKLVGAARLSNQLFIYSAGLYPLLAHAAINVRPVLLTLYEDHLVPIAEYLKPGLSGFLNGVLPGLEEGADHYGRTSTLLDRICAGVGSGIFYGCLWKCIAENGQIRLPAFSYILAHLDRKQLIEDQVEILGLNVDLMVGSLCASLEDPSVLVQRSALEFLLAAFPLHSANLILQPDVVKLLSASVTALLRRDMSLNRRLFTWLLGNEVQLNGESSLLSRSVSEDAASADSSNANSYFHRHSKMFLIEALQLILKVGCSSKPPDLRPYRVLISLLEKPEIGPTILDDILVDVFRALYLSNRVSEKEDWSKSQHEELVKTANLLFGTLEECYVWSYTGRLLQKSTNEVASLAAVTTANKEVQPVGTGPPHFLEMCSLTVFLLETLSVDSSSDTQVEYLPSLLVQTADLLHASCGCLSWSSIGAGIDLCLTLLKKIRPVHEAEEWAGSYGEPGESAGSSGEFILHANSSSPAGSPPALVSSSQHQKQLLELAAVAVQQLLAKLLNPGVFRSTRSALLEQAKESLSLKPPEVKQPSLEEMMESCLNVDSGPTTVLIQRVESPFEEREESQPVIMQSVGGSRELAEILPVVKQCCNLLKELSTFPTYCAAALASHQVITGDRDWQSLPDWLQLLCLASCCILQNVDTSTCDLHLTATATLLDLTSLTSSMIPIAYWNPREATARVPVDEEEEIPSDSLFTVVLLPVITPSQLLTVIHRSRVFHKLACRLWDGVGLAASLSAQNVSEQCAELLHQLHNSVPPPLRHVAEDVILASLNRQMRNEQETEESQLSSAAIEKFIVLWHLGRDMEPARWGTRRLRTFDACLQLLLDWLSLEPSSPQRTAAEGWLVQALLRNDVSRIMDPLLLKLLHPNSARVSIRHVTVRPGALAEQRQQDRLSSSAEDRFVEDRDQEDNIYAISSVDGQVIYHVTPSSRANSSSNKSRPLTPSKRSVLALGAPGRAIESFVDRQVVFPWQLPQHFLDDQLTVGLFVNPFPEDLPSSVEQTSKLTTLSDSPEPEPESVLVTRALLNELIDEVVNKAVAAAAAARLVTRPNALAQKEPENKSPPAVHPLHNHLLLYCQVSDARSTLHVLRTLRSQLACQPRLFLLNLASTGLAASRSSHASLIQDLLARHRKCLFGQGFHGQVTTEWMAPHRSSMYLEILLQLLLYHLRSFYSSLGSSSLTRQEVTANRQVQLGCVQVLFHLLNELLPLVRDSGRGFASFLSDLLTRCRLQKVVLHSILAMLHVITLDRNKAATSHNQSTKRNHKNPELSLTEEIVLFNEEYDLDNKTSGGTYSEATLIHLVKLLLSIMALEDQLTKQNVWGDAPNTSSNPAAAPGAYQRGIPVHAQPIFTTAILTALRQKSIRWLHTEFTRLLAAGLPFMGRSLPAILNAVVPQICINLESLRPLPFSFPTTHNQQFPPDYLITELEALTALCHYVLIDSSHNTPTLAGSAGLLSWGVSNGINGSVTGPNNGQILHNLVHAFTPNGISNIFNHDTEAGDPYATARRQMLSNLPRILACIGHLWELSEGGSSKSEAHTYSETSACRLQRQKLLEFVSPIGHHHGVSLLAAVSVAWVEKRKDNYHLSPSSGRNSGKFTSNRKIIPDCGNEQMALVDLISSVRVLPPDTLVQLLRQVLKQPLPQAQNRNWRLEVGLLHFFHAYLRKINRTQLGECWGSLLILLREIAVLNAPPVLFAGLVVFGEAVQRYQTPGEKRDQRELQEVTAKLLESCGSVAAACLEQTTWLRRNLSVRRDLPTIQTLPHSGTAGSELGEDAAATLAEDQISSSSSSEASTQDNGGAPVVHQVSVNLSSSNKISRYSVQALFVLAELLAPLQDLVFPSQDKERVIPLLTSLLANVVPYLKHHSQSNIAGMRAASQLLSSLSDFPATRRAWRRDAFDLLLDPTFFAVDAETLRHWRNVIDNLMCHDKDAFREFLGRVSVSPSGLFSSRELEMETRTMLLKRLAFTLFCTDGDQYQRFLPDIQEKLSESLRLASTCPSVQAQVFLCFRVLLLRTSQQHVASLWPSVVAETVQVLSQLEHELRRDTEEFSSQIRRLGALDSTWVTHSANGLQNYANPAWMHLYLSTCKLLHLALALPATRLPQFQMYRWAFVGDEKAVGSCNGRDDDDGDGDISTSSRSIQQQVTPNFVPYLTRIYRLLRNKTEASTKTSPVPAANSNNNSTHLEDLVLPASGEIKSLLDLLPFFQAVDERRSRVDRIEEEAVIISVENLIERDFLEPIPI